MFNIKYEPKCFADLVFQTDDTKTKLERYARGKRTGSILLHGPYGTSKSTTARIIANEAYQNHSGLFTMPDPVLDCADFGSNDAQRIVNGWGFSGGSFSYAVLDEFDLLSAKEEASVRALLSTYEGRHGLIFTTNHLHKIDASIQSRCEVIELPALDAYRLLPMCKRVLSSEGFTLEDTSILEVIKHQGGDIRKVLRQLETLVQSVAEEDAL
jgi:DNA polymerase III delta prime subunit